MSYIILIIIIKLTMYTPGIKTLSTKEQQKKITLELPDYNHYFLYLKLNI